MLTNELAKVGDTVVFKLWVRPYKEVSGIVKKIVDDSNSGTNHVKYFITTKDIKEIPKNTTYRYHPKMRRKETISGEAVLDEEGKEQWSPSAGFDKIDSIIDIIRKEKK